MQELLAFGAPCYPRGADNETPLDLARRNKHMETITALGEAPMFEIIFRAKIKCLPPHWSTRAHIRAEIERTSSFWKPLFFWIAHRPVALRNSLFYLKIPNCSLTESHQPPCPRTIRGYWDHGVMDKNEAVEIIQSHGIKDGHFLVRSSFVLTMAANGTIYHLEINKKASDAQMCTICLSASAVALVTVVAADIVRYQCRCWQ